MSLNHFDRRTFAPRTGISLSPSFAPFTPFSRAIGYEWISGGVFGGVIFESQTVRIFVGGVVVSIIIIIYIHAATEKLPQEVFLSEYQHAANYYLVADKSRSAASYLAE
jgi:hypothetical protein